MANSSVEIELVALINEATKTLKGFRKETQKELDSINFNTGVSAIVSGFSFISDAAKTAFGTISAFASKAIDESINAEKANQQLANSLRLTGDYSAEAVKNFDELATSLAEVTSYGDDAIKSAIALAKTFNATNKEAAQIVRVSADLASVLGISLEDATRKVSGTLSGFIDRDLAKLFPSLKGLSKESLVAGNAIGLIGQRVQGSAQILGNTYAGALFRAQEAGNNFLESLGDLITKNDSIIAGINLVSGAFKTLTQEFNKNKESLSGIVTEGFATLIEIIPSLVKALRFVDTVISSVFVAFYTLGKSIGAVAAALVSLSKLDFQGVKAINEAVSQENAKAFQQNALRIEKFYTPLLSTTEKLAVNISKVATESKKAANEFKNIGVRETRKVEKTPEEIKAEIEKQRRLIEEVSREPIRQIIKLTFQANAKVDSKQFAAIGAGILSQVLKGTEGAKAAISSVFGAVADQFIPGIGGAVGDIVGVLAQGPEKTREAIQGFVKGAPEFIKAIIASIPVLIEELVKAIPQLGAALAAQAPFIAISFATSLIKNIPNIVEGFAKEFLKIPEQFLNELLNLIPGGKGLLGGGDGGGGIIGGITGAIGDVVGSIGDIFGFAQGGRVPDSPKYLNDRFPAKLSAGEQVLSKDLTNKLESYLNNQNSQPITINWVVGQQVLAKAVLDLNRNGFRTA